MKTPAMYINDLKNRGLARSDADVSRLLGVSRTAICYWQDGRSAPNAEQALRLAELLKIDAGEILAECEAARAKTPEARKAWERVAARMAGATMAGIVTMTALPQDAHALTSDYRESVGSNFQKC